MSRASDYNSGGCPIAAKLGDGSRCCRPGMWWMWALGSWGRDVAKGWRAAGDVVDEVVEMAHDIIGARIRDWSVLGAIPDVPARREVIVVLDVFLLRVRDMVGMMHQHVWRRASKHGGEIVIFLWAARVVVGRYLDK